MADFSLIPDQSNIPTTTLTPNTTDNTLEIKGNPDNIIQSIINGGINDGEFVSNSKFAELFNSYIKIGTSDPDSNIDKRCRIYIKYE